MCVRESVSQQAIESISEAPLAQLTLFVYLCAVHDNSQISRLMSRTLGMLIDIVPVRH